jgi:predicted esterase
MTQDFEAIKTKVFDLYGQQRYREALELSRRIQDDHRATGSYWSACFLSLMGKTEDAFASLDRALDSGAWWSPLTLERDPDLEALRGSTRFKQIVEASRKRWLAAWREEPEIQMLAPHDQPPEALLIALHGSGEFSMDAFAERWKPATSYGVAVAVPRSTQPANSDGGATWHDFAQTERDLEITYQLAKAEFATTRVVMGGFSAGGEAAITAAVMNRPAIAASGFISVGPGINPAVPQALNQADPSLRGWITVGEKDWAKEGCQCLHDRARDLGLLWRIEIIDGVGHAFPDDFGSRLPLALSFVLLR